MKRFQLLSRTGPLGLYQKLVTTFIAPVCLTLTSTTWIQYIHMKQIPETDFTMTVISTFSEISKIIPFLQHFLLMSSLQQIVFGICRLVYCCHDMNQLRTSLGTFELPNNLTEYLKQETGYEFLKKVSSQLR